MVAKTGSTDQTPGQTVSRVLQELRNDGVLFFSETGIYVFNTVPINALVEYLPEDALESLLFQDLHAIKQLIGSGITEKNYFDDI